LNKHILLITYYWPPDNSSGVQRWAYFAHYLDKLGHTVEVVTVDPAKASYKNTDDSFTQLVKDIKLHTTSTFELLKAYSLLTTGDSKKGIPRGSVDDNKSILKKVANKIKADFFVPDARVGWNRFALTATRLLVKQDTIIITTGPPQSTHLVGLELKNIFPNNTWIADFRDPWLELYSNKDQPQSKWAALKNARLEDKVLQQADAVTTIGPSLAKMLEKKVSKKEKVHYFYNGYDEAKMENVTPYETPNFTITFIGLLAEDYDTAGFLAALKIFALAHSPTKIALTLAGNIAQSFLNQANEIENLEVHHKGFVSHTESLRLMKSASLLFTILPSQEQDEIIISGKMMEYLAARKPILCIGNRNGDAASLIDQCEAGTVVNHNQSEAMTKFMEQCYSEEFILKSHTDISQYSRKEVADKFAILLKDL
jgi:glycosyltransferase involved in cell wall biosynthesis